MSTEDEARKAIEEVNGRDVQGRQVAVKEAEDRRGGSGGGGGGGGVASAAAVAAATAAVAAVVAAVDAVAVVAAAAVAGDPRSSDSPAIGLDSLSPLSGERVMVRGSTGPYASSFMPCMRRVFTRAA